MATKNATRSARKRPHAEALRRRNIQGALWQNRDGDGKAFYVASVTRSYKDGDGNWQNEVLQVPLDDIPRVREVLRELETRAYQSIEADYQASRDEAA